MAKENPSINDSKGIQPQPTQTPASPKTPGRSKPSSTQHTSGSKPSTTHRAEDDEETPKTFDETQTTQTQQEAEVTHITKRD